MKPEALLQALHVAERLKDTPRHCTTSAGRPESVAEHSWRLSLMAYWVCEEFEGLDREKLLKMCLIHDLGEAFTGDIPTFDKTAADEQREASLLYGWVDSLPAPVGPEMRALFEEMEARQTLEARIFKALDNMEAVIQHNESPLSTWAPHERQLNLTYGYDKAAFSAYLTALRDLVRAETERKLAEG